MGHLVCRAIYPENPLRSQRLRLCDVFLAHYYYEVVSTHGRPILHPCIQVTFSEGIIKIKVDYPRCYLFQVLYEQARHKAARIYPNEIEA